MAAWQPCCCVTYIALQIVLLIVDALLTLLVVLILFLSPNTHCVWCALKYLYAPIKLQRTTKVHMSAQRCTNVHVSALRCTKVHVSGAPVCKPKPQYCPILFILHAPIKSRTQNTRNGRYERVRVALQLL